MELMDGFIDLFYTDQKYSDQDICNAIECLYEEGITKEYAFSELIKHTNMHEPAKGKKVKVSFAVKLLTPSVYFIYKLYNGGELVYIGQSYNLANRLQSHRRTKTFDQVKIHMCSCFEDADILENYLILKHQPVLNRSVDMGKARLYNSEDPVFELLEEPTSLFAPIVSKVKNNRDRTKYLSSFKGVIGVKNMTGETPYWVRKEI